MTNLSPTIERYTSYEEFCELKFFLNVMVTKLLSKTFIKKLNTQVFILSAEKLKEKWKIFER
jgi:hypothetical protein